MALAYTPGLKIKELTAVQKIRTLPIKGDVLVKEGDRVSHDTIVARAEIKGHVSVVSVSQILHVDSSDIHTYMTKKVGEPINGGELLARRSSFFGLSKASCIAPTTGVIEFISEHSGQVTIRHENIPIELNAYIDGVVSMVIPEVGVVIDTPAAFLQGIYGIGAEAHGELIVISDSPGQAITVQDIKPEHKGKILVGGSSVSVEALEKLVEVEAKGFISGSIDSEDLITFTKGKIGFGVTGFEEMNVTLIFTEGFGKRSIADKAYKILKEYSGKEVSINGETQIRAGVVRPEVIIPRPEINLQGLQAEAEVQMNKGMEIGMMVRGIRAPFFGEIGHVSNMTSGLEVIETGSSVRVLEMELSNGTRVVVPRANVEIIE